MYDARTVFCRHVVAEDDAESLAFHLDEPVAAVLAREHLLRMSGSIVVHELRSKFTGLLHRLYPWHELPIVQALEFRTRQSGYDTIGDIFVAALVGRQFAAVRYLAFRFQIGSDTA